MLRRRREKPGLLGFRAPGLAGAPAARYPSSRPSIAGSAAQLSHEAAGIRPFMHRLGVGELEQLLQIESVAKASWFGHDPGDGHPSPCDDHLFAGLHLGQHGRKPGLCGSHADSMHQGDLNSWSDDQAKHRLALLTPRRRAEQHPLLPAGTNPHNSTIQHDSGIGRMGQFRVSGRAPSDGGGPGISVLYLLHYPHHLKTAAPERPPPGGMR